MNQRVCTSQPKEQFSGVSTQLFQRLRDAFSQFKTQTRHFVHPIIRMLLESQQDEKRQVLSMVTPWVLCVILPASCHPHLGINTLVQSTPGTGDGDLPSCGCRNQKWSQRPRVQVQEELGEERLLSFFLCDQSNTQIRMMVTFICHSHFHIAIQKHTQESGFVLLSRLLEPYWKPAISLWSPVISAFQAPGYSWQRNSIINV